jgi:serine protease Do
MRTTPAIIRALLSSALLVLGSEPPARADAPPSPAAALPGASQRASQTVAAIPGPAPSCAGEYADDLAALSARAKEFEQAQKPYTFCIRTTAVYECPSYAPDGALRRARRTVVARGTGFAFRQQAHLS